MLAVTGLRRMYARSLGTAIVTTGVNNKSETSQLTPFLARPFFSVGLDE